MGDEPKKQKLVPKFVNFTEDQVEWFQTRGLAISTIVRQLTDWLIEDEAAGRITIEVGKLAKNGTKEPV